MEQRGFWECVWKNEQLQKDIDELDLKEMEDSLTNEKIAKKEGWKNELEHLNLLGDKRRQQKMTMKCVKEGDGNSIFFQGCE